MNAKVTNTFFRHTKIPKFTFLQKLFQDVSNKMQDSYIIRNIGWICITETDFSNLKEERRFVVTYADTNLNNLAETIGQGLERLSSGITQQRVSCRHCLGRKQPLVLYLTVDHSV